MQTAFGTEVRPLYYSVDECEQKNAPESPVSKGSFVHHQGFTGKTEDERAELLKQMQKEHVEGQSALASEPIHAGRECFELGDEDDHHHTLDEQQPVQAAAPTVPSFTGPSSRFETAVAEWDFVSCLSHLLMRLSSPQW